VAVYTSGPSLVRYWHPDWLGSIRPGSNPNQTISYDGAYAPYGEQYAGTGNADFTGQVADTETDMYDFLYREYHYIQGRWISPDPAGLAAADPTNPQTWNRYAYVGNNPLALTDPLGLDGLGDNNCYAAYNANIINCLQPCDITMVTCNCDPQIGPCWPPGGGGGWPGGLPNGGPSISHNIPSAGNADQPPSTGSDVCVTVFGIQECAHSPFPTPTSGGGGGAWWIKVLPVLGAAPWILPKGANGPMQNAAQATRVVRPTPPPVPNPVPGEAPEIQLEDPFWKHLFQLMSEWLHGGGNGLFPPSVLTVPTVSPCVLPQFQQLPMCGGAMSGGMY